MKKRFLIILFLLIGIFNFSVKAQLQQTNRLKDNKANTKEIFSTKNLLIIGGLAGSSFLADKWAKEQLQEHKTHFLTSYTDVLNEFGEKKYVLPATLVTWTVGSLIQDEKLSTTAMNSCKAVLCGAIATESIKILSGRMRPYANQGNHHFNFMKGTTDNTYKSFPSGHSFLAWAVFTPFAESYGKWIYAIPISVGFARMYRNKHWLSDVVLGAGLGYLAGIYFHKRKNQKILFTGNGFVIKF